MKHLLAHKYTAFRVCTAIVIVASFAGFLDATFLTVEHYRGVVPPCSLVGGCEKVTTSVYAVVAGIPVALLGAIYYAAVFVLALLLWERGDRWMLMGIVLFGTVGMFSSLWFVYLQLFVIQAICLYCMFSALTSSIVFISVLTLVRVRTKVEKGILKTYEHQNS